MPAECPLFAILTRKASLRSPLSPGSKIAAGDVLIVANQIFAAVMVFGLSFRDEVSPASRTHHVGALAIAQSAIAIDFDTERERKAL